MTPSRLLFASVLAVPLLSLASVSHAASSYDGCKGFITSLPTTITTQGVWCLNADLATSLATGNAITIGASNITIDCNSFKLGGLAAGPSTATYGINATDRSNISIRDCNIRGFNVGALVGGEGTSGHRIERNRFEGNTGGSVGVYGTASVIRDNLIVDTGGTTGSAPPWMTAVFTQGRVDVVDNHITAVDGAASGSGTAIGVLVVEPDGQAISGNRIGGLTYEEGGGAYGVAVMNEGHLDIRNNTFAGGMPGVSVACAESDGQFLYANALMMGEPSGTCQDGGDNYGLGSIEPPL